MKLIFVDIDGTLTRPGENVPPDSALAAIRAAQAKGNKVFLCTGRNPDMLSPLLVYGFDGYVGCGGGYVVAGDEVLYDCPMTDEQRDTALKTLHDNGVFCTIEAKGGSWGDENLGEFLSGQSEGNSEIERWRKALSANLGIRPMSTYDGSPIYKVVIMCTAMEQLADAKAALEFTDNKEAASYVGTLIGKRALEAGITEVVFDRGGFLYHGKIAALADAAREAGLQF